MLVIVKCLACFFLVCLFAQLDLGSIDRTATDSSGAVVAGAKVQIKNPDTEFTQELVTNAEGLYSAPLLHPGNYQILWKRPGFGRAVRSGIALQVQDELKIDCQLQVGQATESVEVTAEAPLLQSESASRGQVIDSRKITELPLTAAIGFGSGGSRPALCHVLCTRSQLRCEWHAQHPEFVSDRWRFKRQLHARPGR